MNRRTLLQMTPGLLLSPRKSYASSEEQNFVFVFCEGGWDQCYFAAPIFDSPLVDMENNVQLGETQGIQFVDSPYRPSVRDFFESFGDQTCLINGIESRSVAHDICLRLMCTGSSLGNMDDWASIIAAHSNNSPIMPQVSISGPSYTNQFDSTLVRVGSSGQLSALLSSEMMNELSAVPHTVSQEEKEEAWFQAVLAQRETQASQGRAKEILQKTIHANEQRQRLEALRDELSLSSSSDLGTNLALARDILAFGSSRCIMIGFKGFQGLGFDTHAANHLQGIHLEELFSEIHTFVGDLQQTQSPAGNPLIQNTTIVVLSEMGRFPQINSREGKEHWTFTSSMLIGAGIRGGQTIGGYNNYCFGKPIDLQTGESRTDGVDLVPQHLGSTLLSLANIDPIPYTNTPPIRAVLL